MLQLEIFATQEPQMSPETRYRIDELEQLTGLSRRLIYDYISRELVPAALGSGKGAYYLQEHYDRLRLISLLRTMGFRLERVEEALHSWSPDEIARIVEFAEGRDMESLDALNDWLVPPARAAEVLQRPAQQFTSADALERVRKSGARPEGTARSQEMSDLMAVQEDALREDDMSAVQMLSMAAEPFDALRESPLPAQTWHRVQLTPDIEINYRPDIDRTQRRRIEELIARAKELFNNE
jgi:DNA-binding transcriptional MerR regulator